MSNKPDDKALGKTVEKDPKKKKRPRRWQDRRKIISVDDFEVKFEEDGMIHSISAWHACMKSPQYREWLVDQGFWIPAMDLSELCYTMRQDSSEDEEEKNEKMKAKPKKEEVKESLSKRMAKLKAQQKHRFHFFAEENGEKPKESKNSKSSETKKVDRKEVSPKPKLTRNIEKSKIPEQKDTKLVKTPKKEEPKAPKKPEEPPKETVRSQYCYTEMHLASGKEARKNI